MNIDGKPYRTIFPDPDGESVQVIDQTRLPFAFELKRLATLDDAAVAIRTMIVRGAPLIGVTAAYGLALAMRADPSADGIDRAAATLAATRPTAINLRWALERVAANLRQIEPHERFVRAFAEAGRIAEEDVASCRAIGAHGSRLIADLHRAKGRPITVLTHCNAGWLATVDWGTALAPIYAAHEAGVPVRVLVDETRPRNQGAALTAFELNGHGVPHTVISDNAGGHLMQHGQVDLCIVGSDRTTASGDVCNKIGTYLKALAARDTGVPFYAALPFSTIDWTLHDGVKEIPIEERDGREVTHLTGRLPDGGFATVEVVSPGSPVANPAFDVTPARLVTGLITERGVCEATPEGLLGLYPERRAAA
ncbi:S-methyl-5-thioribose-1-phosphate isomerase [Methylobacterium sp. NEAU 140]|uniref:S-methyl-5-thioribose-1-phosphate isomerase n=1 Tax=Methylobacterium sp. NEAU 140 TaxID=3064945 RepID=UPI002735DCB7|nr:S-methyl-5-thioribose-1-phosphate isomerase [Methylobacterium sp. NEAU 140]MDP4025496.1 S-methyl-5-thioribose-1-phosphate isomerase [Methylobacterium sp. NEAU 140]